MKQIYYRDTEHVYTDSDPLSHNITEEDNTITIPELNKSLHIDKNQEEIENSKDMLMLRHSDQSSKKSEKKLCIPL